MSLHPSRCNGYVGAQDNKAARQMGVIRLCLFALLLGLLVAAPVATARERPNLLVVMTDDQRAEGTMDVMPETVRRIGGQGVTFTNAHTTTPKCCPSRASFFTGLYTHNHGVRSNRQSANLDQTITVQRRLQQEGYRTAIFGKFLNGWKYEDNPPFFDTWAISPQGYKRTLWNVNGVLRLRRGYSTDFAARHTVRFIRKADRLDDEQPWLAWVTPFAPHLPTKPPARFRDAPLPAFPLTPAMEETDVSDKPDFLERARHQEEKLVTMRDDGRRALMAVDQLVERVLNEVRRTGEADNTMVVYTSDNGYMLGEHGGVIGKDLPYPGSTRIPLLVRWPRYMPAGQINANLFANIDVPRTMLDAAGIEHNTDGRSLFDAVPRDALFLEHRGSYGEDGSALMPAFETVRTPGYRYTEYYVNGTYDLLFREYYDLSVDPWELENQVDALPPEQLDALSQQLAEYRNCDGSACP